MVESETDELISGLANVRRPGSTHSEFGHWLNLRIRGILSVSSAQEEHDALQRVLCDPMWNIVRAYSCRQASVQLCRDRVAVIVCRDKLPDGTWRDVLSYIAELISPPSVVVTCDKIDEGLRSEVHELGGFDILDKTLDPETITHVIRAAWYHHSVLSETMEALH